VDRRRDLSAIRAECVNNDALEARVIGARRTRGEPDVVGHSGTSPQAHASSDALWVSPGGLNWQRHTLLRIPLDSATASLSARIDTLHTGVHTSFRRHGGRRRLCSMREAPSSTCGDST
jgi:hypothetical protein